MKFEQIGLEYCPDCGESWRGWGQYAIGGTLIEAAGCCGCPMEIVVNWEVFEGLPENLQQMMRDRIAAEWAGAKEDHAKAPGEWNDITEYMRVRGLLKGEERLHKRLIPMHE